MPGLTHLRALAILLVFVYHYGLFAHPPWIERLGAFGWSGVDLFFVLSGFLISRQLFRADFSASTFYFKRATRILPAYLVVVAAYFCFPSIHEREALPPLWKFLTFTQNLGLDVSRFGTFSHAWSLCIEEQFYLLLPLVWLALRQKAVWLLPSLVALGLLIRAYICLQTPLTDDADWYRWIYYPTWSRLDGLLVGIALAALYQRWPEKLTAPRLLPLAVILWAAAWWAFVEPRSLIGSVLAFPAIAIVYGVWLLAALHIRRASSIAHWLATLSYSLYLTHKAAIHVAQVQLVKLGLAPNGNAMFVCCAVASLVGAALLHFAVERPFLEWRNRRLDSSVKTSLRFAAADAQLLERTGMTLEKRSDRAQR